MAENLADHLGLSDGGDTAQRSLTAKGTRGHIQSKHTPHEPGPAPGRDIEGNSKALLRRQAPSAPPAHPGARRRVVLRPPGPAAQESGGLRLRGFRGRGPWDDRLGTAWGGWLDRTSVQTGWWSPSCEAKRYRMRLRCGRRRLPVDQGAVSVSRTVIGSVIAESRSPRARIGYGAAEHSLCRGLLGREVEGP